MLFFTKGENHRPKGMKTRIWAHKKKCTATSDALSVILQRIYYFATFSRRLRIANTKNAARRQIPVNTPQTTVSEAPHIRAGIDTRKLPSAVATNQPPIIIPLYFGGATFVTNEIPIGESNNSANVSTRYVEINQFGDTSAMCIG